MNAQFGCVEADGVTATTGNCECDEANRMFLTVKDTAQTLGDGNDYTSVCELLSGKQMIIICVTSLLRFSFYITLKYVVECHVCSLEIEMTV